MARISLGICLMLVVASSVIYEAQGTFLLKKYLRSKFPRKCNEFTPYANKGMILLVTNLEDGCPATAEFKNFFTQIKSYMNFIETASATSKNIDVEMTTKCDGLLKAMSELNGGAAGKSADAGSFKATMISMGKTLIEQKKNTMMMTLAQKKSLVLAMVSWTRKIATIVKTASEKKGKTIDITSYGLDVDVNDKSIISVSGSSESSSSSTKTETGSSTKSGTVAGSGNGSTKTKETSGGSTEKGSLSTKTEDASSKKAGGSGSTKSGSGSTFKDTTGGNAGSPSGSPTSSPSATGKTSEKGSVGASASGTTMKTQSNTGSTSVKKVESETSKEVMSFIMELEKKHAGKAELKPFFENLKTSMTAYATISSKTAQDYSSTARSATGKLVDAMTFVGSRFSKSAKMKSNIETCQDQLVKTLKELQDINSKIVSAKTVTSTQQTELKQTITKWEKITTQFVEAAASSSSYTSSSSQHSQQYQQSQEQRSTSSQQQSSMGMVKNN